MVKYSGWHCYRGEIILITDIDSWISELLETGFFIQDFNLADVSEQAQTRFNRYIELLEQIEGNEGPEVVRALCDSIQMTDDYGVYQLTLDKLGQFIRPGYARCYIEGLVKIIQIRPDLANDLLIMIAQATESDAFIKEFNRELTLSNKSAARRVICFILAEEEVGRLDPFHGIFARDKDQVALG